MEISPSTNTGNEQLVVDVKYTQRQVVPTVRLEQKKIKMTKPPDAVPCIVTITEDETADNVGTIVGGSDPLGEETKSKDVPQTNGHRETMVTEEEKPGSRLTVQFAELPTKRSSAHIMEFFEEQEKSFQEQFKSFPRKTRKQRSPSPSTLRQSVGLDHLDNLVRLMEQLGQLRDENAHLKKRCAYLESTKHLLQVKSSLAEEGLPLGYMSLPSKSKPRLRKSNTDPESKDHQGEHKSRPRLASAEDAQCIDYGESSSDQSPKRPKTGTLHKRSFSTGSLEVPSDILDQTVDEHGHLKVLSKSKTGKESSRVSALFGSKSPKAKSSKSSKWARVIKVITGQKLYEDLGFSFKSLKEIGKHTHVRYHSVSTAQELSPPSQRVLESRSLDSGVSSSLDVDPHGGPRTSTSSAEAPSPGKSPNLTEDKDDDLCTEIWMGPPGWIEKHESRKTSGASAMSDEVSTVIELRSKCAGVKEGEKFLKVKPIPRRQSSPALGKDMEATDMDEFDDVEASVLHRSSSYRDAELDSMAKDDDASTVKSIERESKKLHKTPWGRVKDMIHTRKDSLKKKQKKEKGDWELSESSELDIEALAEEHLRSDQFSEGVISRSTPKTSPIAIRQRSSKSCSESPPGILSKSSPTKPTFQASSLGNVDMTALLATGMSDEYVKKLQAWEELKSRKPLSSQTAIVEESDGTSQDSSFVSQDSMQRSDADKLKSRSTSQRQTQGRDSSGEESPDDATTPVEVLGPNVNVDELQRKVTESFSRKLQEWERIKYRKDTMKEGSPEIERKGSKSRKDDRQKSKKSREEKEKEKMEKQRERDWQKVEREQIKLEKEKMRLEKERLRALEREAKLEKMKGKLSQSEVDPSFKNPVLSPLAEYKVTANFARKLHEWELMKGLSHDISTAIYLEAQKRSLQQGREPQEEIAGIKQESLQVQAEGAAAHPKSPKPPPLTLQPYWDSPEDTSPIEKSSEASVGDDTSITEESMTKSNIASVPPFGSLERANAQLLEELQRKELEYASVQEEVRNLNTKLQKVRDDHASEMAHFRKDTQTGGQSVKVEVHALESTVSELEEKIQQLELFGEKLAESMESAAIGKWHSIEGEESVNVQLMELIEQMRVMLLQASQTEEVTQKSTALHNFEKLYSQAMQLQVQMNNLRLSHLERNKEIMDIKRQLLLQEVNNLMLQADISHRESELYHYQEAKKYPGSVRRWNTFSGGEHGAPQGARVVEGHETTDRPPLQRFISLKDSEPTGDHGPPEQHKDTQSITAQEQQEGTEEVFGLKADGTIMSPVTSTTESHSRTKTDKCHEKSTDHVEKHLKTTNGTAKQMGMKEDEHQHPGKHDDTHELTYMLSLPTAKVLLPKDISQTELKVPKVEKGSPTLEKEKKKPTKQQEHKPLTKAKTETPTKPIPEGLRSLEKPKLVKSAPVIDDEYSPTAETVMKCTESEVDTCKIRSVSVSDTTGRVDITVHRKPVSPVIRTKQPHKLRDTRRPMRDTDPGRSTSSSKTYDQSDPGIMPPLLQQSTPMIHSHVSRACIDTGVRSHSADEIIHHQDDQPVHDMIKKFEKRATVCETAQHTLDLRKTPSPTLHLPQVGFISPVRRLKPAAELLEESQRYRSGHSVYATRIIQRYLIKDESKRHDENTRGHDKENISSTGYVQTMVKRLSREGTPTQSVDSSKTNSSLSLQRTDSPRSQSEFVSHIVRKLSSPSGPEHHKIIAAPFKDVTNDGHVKKMAEVFDTSTLTSSPERTLSDSEVKEYRKLEQRSKTPSKRRSCELGALHDTSYQVVTTLSSSVISSESSLKPDSTISPTNHQSMPLLYATERQASLEEARDRSATISATSEHAQSYMGKRPDPDEEITTVSKEFQPSSAMHQASAPLSPATTAFPKTSPKMGRRTEVGKLPSPKLHERRGGKIKMGTIGVLCKQSMSFDLGVSLHATEEMPVEGVSYRKQKMSDSSSPPTSVRLSSTSSEGESAPTSPTEEKKRSRRFLEAKWLQKPKKFFKVSK